MRTATVNWLLPSTRDLGGDLSEQEIAGVEVELALEGTNPVQVAATVAPPISGGSLSHTISDLDFANWYFRLTVLGTDGQRGNPVDAPFAIVDTSPPGTVTNVTVDLS